MVVLVVVVFMVVVALLEIVLFVEFAYSNLLELALHALLPSTHNILHFKIIILIFKNFNFLIIS